MGVVKLLAEKWKRPAKPPFETFQFLALLLLYGFFWIGLLYAVLINFVHLGASATTGWYMYALVVPEALLVYYGLAALFTERWSRRLLPLLTALFAGIDLFATKTGIKLCRLQIAMISSRAGHASASTKMVTELDFGFWFAVFGSVRLLSTINEKP